MVTQISRREGEKARENSCRHPPVILYFTIFLDLEGDF